MNSKNKKTKPNSVRAAVKSVLDFKGFDDYVELFKAGEQTDSLGQTQNFTTDDLDEMVSNHESFPIVVGHPKVDAPAYGWSSELKREGDSLFGKFSNVESQFADMVENKRFPNRSLRIRKTADGFKVGHVGFLGAVPPAIPGLKAMEFSSDDTGMEFEFSGYTETVLARMMRRTREFLIDKFDVETADKVMPEYELEALTEEAMRERAEERKSPDTLYNRPDTTGGAAVPQPKTYNQSDLDKAVADALKLKESEFSTQLNTERKARLTSDYNTFVSGLIDEGKLTPAFAAGMTDFMLQLTDGAEFEFSQGDEKTVVTKPVDWFKEFVSGLGKTVKLGAIADEDVNDTDHHYNAPNGAVVSAERLALDKTARDYAAKHNVDYVEALVAVGA